MSTKAELLEWANRIEAGEANFGGGIRAQVAYCLGNKHLSKLLAAIDGSLDAAKALHDAVLLGCDMKLSSVRAGTTWRVCIWPNLAEVRKLDFWGEASNPAAAWVAAILRAKAGEMD